MSARGWARAKGIVRALAVATLALGAAGCALDRATVPSGRAGLVIHAVLDPNQREYVVLVEETLTGRVAVDGAPDPSGSDPIVASGGIPVSGATVTIRGEGGASAVGIEDASVRGDHRGRGVYRFVNAQKAALCVPCTVNYLELLRGEGYTLTVSDNVSGALRLASGQTRIPQPLAGASQVLGRPLFDRDRDSVVVRLPSFGNGARALVRVSSPYAPFALFTDSAAFTVPGDLRNPFAELIPPVFVPGFRAQVVVASVDSNYFDYFRSANSPFTGSGLINHLRGATGVFGAFLPLATRRLDVTAQFRDPADGKFVGGASGQDTLYLWVGERLTSTARVVSGSVRYVSASGFLAGRVGVLGVIENGQLALRVLKAEVADDVDYTLTGAAGGSTLTLASGPGRTLTFRRAQ